jgi:hypothetical protein
MTCFAQRRLQKLVYSRLGAPLPKALGQITHFAQLATLTQAKAQACLRRSTAAIGGKRSLQQF